MMQPSPSSDLHLEEARQLVRQLDQKLAGLNAVGGLSLTNNDGEKRLEQVVEFASTVLSTSEPEAVLEKTVLMVLQILPADHAFLSWREHPTSMLEQAKSVKKNDGNFWAIEKFARSVADHVVTIERATVSDDVRLEPGYREEVEAYDLDVGSMMCLPLFEDGRSRGALYISRTRNGRPLTPLDRKVADALALIAGRALAAACTLREQQERRARLELINRLYRATASSLELQQVLDQVCQIMVEAIKAERAFILLTQQGNLRVVAGRNAQGSLPQQASRDLSKTVIQKVMATGEGVYILDAPTDQEFSSRLSVVNLKLNSVVAVPLTGQSGLNGVLYIDSQTKALSDLNKELEMLSAIANVASMAVENARLFTQATVDGMTGLYVRSYFNTRLDDEMRRAKRYGRQLSLVVMDIDFFKKFNDTYGHQTGDEVIKMVAHVLRSSIRNGIDFPGRYGGEELVLILPETSTEGAQILADRIRQRVESASLRGPKGEALKVTISLGVATFPQMAETPDALFALADQALYESKRSGRNRTTVYHPDLAKTSAQ